MDENRLDYCGSSFYYQYYFWNCFTIHIKEVKYILIYSEYAFSYTLVSMKIYTKTGDSGKTSLGSGERVWKSSHRVNAYGTVDELNSWLGIILAELAEIKKPYKKELARALDMIQSDLFSIGAYLANSKRDAALSTLKEHIEKFEHLIDAMTEKLPELKNFILPQGGKAGSAFHFARSLTRRAERELVKVMLDEELDPKVIQYINRLSDLFFTMARYVNFKDKKKEIGWRAYKLIK